MNRGTMGVNSLPKTVTRRGCDLNPGPTAPESSTLTTRLPSHPSVECKKIFFGGWSLRRATYVPNYISKTGFSLYLL